MRQVVIPHYGPPEVFQVRDAPEPTPARGEVRIRVRAAGVNFADVLARLGLYPDAPPPPVVVGYEVAGVIDAIGPEVTRITPGDRVVAVTRFGGYADAVTVPQHSVYATPTDLSDAEACAIPVNYLTAYIALYRMANLTPGDVVLIYGAAGGVGTAAIQLARARRATIIGTASAAKHDALRSFGVDHVLDPKTTDVVREVRRITKGRGVDIALDPVGGASFETSYSLLAPLGRLVLYGVSALASGERRNWWRVLREVWRMPRFKAFSLINRNRGVFGLNLGHLWDETRALQAAMDFLVTEVRAGRLRPVVSKTFPLDEAAAAHRFLQNRLNIGKVVLTT